MNTTHIQKDIAPLLGLNELSEEEREVFLEDVGNLILESTCARLVAEMNEHDTLDFQDFVDKYQDEDEFVLQLEKHYPAFTDIFKEEVEAFRKEALEVIGTFDEK